MASVIVSLEGQSVRRSSGKPKKVLRGDRRKHAQKLLQQLFVVFRQDAAESARGTKLRYTPALVLGNQNSRWNNAVATLIERLEEMLNKTA